MRVETQSDNEGEPRKVLLGTCFDAELASFPTVVLPIDELIDIFSVTHAPERVGEYREAMLGGRAFPPISVVRLAGRFFVADGHKRLNAYRTLGYPQIVVERWPLRRWLQDHWAQARKNIRNQWAQLTRGLLRRDATGKASEVLSHYTRHWKRIIGSILARARR